MSGSQPDNITQSNDVPEWARGYANSFMSRANRLSKDPYTSRIAGFSDDQTNAMDQIRTAANNPFTQGYNEDVGNTLRGYAAGNSLDITKAPGFQNALDRVQQAYSTGIAPQTAAAFANAGAGPLGESSAYRETMGYNNRGFADSLQKLIGDQYNTQQGLQMQAASALPQYMQAQYINPNMLNQIGLQQQQLSQDQLSDAYDYPREQLDFFSNIYSRGIGGTGTTTSPNPARGSRAAGALGGALAGGAGASMLGATMTGTGLAGPWGLALGAGLGALGGGLL